MRTSSSSIFTAFRFMVQGVAASLPLCVLFLRPGLMDKFVAYYDNYREPIVEAVDPQPQEPSALV